MTINFKIPSCIGKPLSSPILLQRSSGFFVALSSLPVSNSIIYIFSIPLLISQPHLKNKYMKKNFSFFRKPIKYLAVLILLCSFNQAFATVSATISGTATICSGSSTILSVALTGGTTPWHFTWSDGTTHHAVTGISSSPYTFSVSPTVNTTYTIVSDSDATNTAGTVHGSAVITVQMTGTYTINPSGSGTTNYTTFNAAVTDVINRGVCGPVIFNVANDTFTEQVRIHPVTNTITGASATNTVTFQSASGDSSKAVLTYPSSSSSTDDYTLDIDGPAYLVFHKITIMRSGTNQYNAVVSLDAGHNETFTNDQFIAGNYTSGGGFVVISSTNYQDTDNIISHNYIQGGSVGIDLDYGGGPSSTGNIIEYNTVTQFYSWGIGLEDQNNCTVQGNVISNSLSTSSYGIYLKFPFENTVVEQNKIDLNLGGIGLNFSTDTETDAGSILVENNFITVGDTTVTNGTPIGISSNDDDYNSYYNNSINIIEKYSSTTGIGMSLNSPGGHDGNIDIDNNAVATTGRGKNIVISGTGYATYVSTCNYNDYYTRGTYIGSWSGSNKTNLAAWQTATSLDANTLTINPLYISSTNLHTYNPTLKAGTSLSDVADDIDGNARNSIKPYIGAYEITPTSVNGSTIVCAGSTVNYTSPIHTGSSYTWTVTGQTSYSGGSTNSVIITWGNANTGTLKVQEINELYEDSAFAIIAIDSLPGANVGSASTICNGGNTSIGAGSLTGNTYSWTSDPSGFTSTSSNPTISPTTTTTYTLIETITTTGCTNSNTVALTVNPLPGANVGSASTICNGGNASIGAGSVTANTYSWTSNPSDFISTSSNPSVSPTTTTTYTLTETITATGCTNTNSVIVTANPLPSANTGSAHAVCKGSSTSIGASSISGHTYSWTSAPSGFTSTAANPSVSPTTTTTYTLTETITATSCTKSNSVVITVNSVPNSILDSSDALICKGDTVEIGDDTTSGYSYSWTSSPSGYTPTGSYGLVEPTVTTTYLLKETITATGCSTTDTILVTVDPGPAANVGSNQTICGGSTANIGGTAVSGNEYVWFSKPVGFTSDTSSPIVSLTTTTTYYLTEIVPAGCAKSDSVVITVHPAPAANVGTDSSITNCDAGHSSISIGASSISGHTYSWTSSPSGFTSTSANPTVTPTANTTYILTETITSTGCTNTHSINVTLIPSNSYINLKVHLNQTN